MKHILEYLKKITPLRMSIMMFGIFLIGLCVASFRLSRMGTDAFTCMNLGISGFNGMLFGNWQLIMNAAIFIVVLFTVRHLIGIGTIINMILVGYIADFICWLVLEQLHLTITLPIQIVLLVIGMLFATSGCAIYMTADLGISPYDSVPFIITKFTKNKISFRVARMISDITVMIIGVTFCVLAKNPLGEIIGIGTVVNAFLCGPLIHFFKGIMEKCLHLSVKEEPQTVAIHSRT